MVRTKLLAAATGLLLCASTSVASATTTGVEAGAAAVSEASAHAANGGYPVWAFFSDPLTHDGRDLTIHTELQRMIDAAPAGSTIRGNIYSLSIGAVADSLLAAQTRGVTVQLSLDAKNADSTAAAITTIKKITNHVFCGNSAGGNSCISTSADGDAHTKLFTFSSTTDPNGVARSNVAWFGSANLTYA